MNKWHRISALLAVTAMAFNIISVFPVRAEEAVSISTFGDLKTFMEKCVYDEYSKNKKFVLQNDIDAGGEKLECAEVFCGTFEGGGHSIRNVSLDFEGSERGFFGSVAKGAKVSDLNVSGEIKVKDEPAKADTASILRERASSVLSKMNITSDDLDSGAQAAGGIAGYNAGTIVNCSFSGKITAKKQVGGIVGYNAMTGIVDSCTNGAEINGSSETGGIAGYNEGRVKLSKNTGKICPDADEKTKNIGGISGNSEGALFACANEGAVGGESFGDNVGGISGKQSGEIRECINNGSVTGRRSVGGVCGRFEPYTDIELSYDAAKAALDKQIDTFNDDIDAARKKITDLAEELFDGKGIISDILDRLGIKEGSGSARLDRLTDSATNMMDNVSDTLSDARGKNISGSIKDTLKSVSDFSDEARTSVKDVSDSLDDSLENLDEFIDEFDGKGEEISNTLSDLSNTLNSVTNSMNSLDMTLGSVNDSIVKGQDDVDEIKDRLFNELDDMDDDIDDLIRKLDETHSNLQFTLRQLRVAGNIAAELFDDLDDIVVETRNELRKMKRAIEDLRTAIENRTKQIKNDIDNAKNNLETMIPTLPPVSIPTELPIDIGGYSVDEDTEEEGGGYDVEPSIVGFIRDALAPVAYAEKDDDDDLLKTSIVDLKSTDVVMPRLIGDENADTALIRYSINSAEVSGDEMAGGVCGSVGFESAIKSGESMTLPDGTKVDANSVLKALIDGCISVGDISVKQNYAGGIAGKCDIGNIENSLSTGEIESEEGSYAGGIAGFSSGEVDNCIAINDISGKSYLGGIAGSGKYISASYSLPRLDSKTDKSGAIAGALSGDAEGTYFIDEGLSGINGVNLEGVAEAVKPEDIASDNGELPEKMPLLTSDAFYMADGDLYMPQIKKIAQNDAEEIAAILQSRSAELAKFHFNVVFTDKGKELRTMTVDYGTVLSDSDIPRLTADGDEVPAWDKDVHSPIVRHTKFTAEYNKATATLSSGEEPPILLVESIFDEGTEVSLKSEDVSHDFTGYRRGNAYSFTLSKNAYDVIKVHIRDEKKKAAKIAVEENGKWTLLDCTIDGSYAVFEVGAPCKFVVLYGGASGAWLIFIICVLAAALAAACAVITLRRVRNNGNKKEKDI